VKDLEGDLHDFGADAVTGEDGELEGFHGGGKRDGPGRDAAGPRDKTTGFRGGGKEKNGEGWGS
jgi:hypothetical protein